MLVDIRARRHLVCSLTELASCFWLLAGTVFALMLSCAGCEAPEARRACEEKPFEESSIDEWQLRSTADVELAALLGDSSARRIAHRWHRHWLRSVLPFGSRPIVVISRVAVSSVACFPTDPEISRRVNNTLRLSLAWLQGRPDQEGIEEGIESLRREIDTAATGNRIDVMCDMLLSACSADKDPDDNTLLVTAGLLEEAGGLLALNCPSRSTSDWIAWTVTSCELSLLDLSQGTLSTPPCPIHGESCTRSRLR